ncbi:hypothetical protein [Sphingorhabdus sp. M41]|uniref:hypothetical protein n=1 Tax=Sphingorhabdus sp. M41 TaxID=1806885 RepID=UPI00078DE2EC|nr:hypothetical protein [Sphingorhabdus sp. M41]AMO72479.1 hypothetical protein AZE99_12005 [Sphingorhabdus sp. M41]
MFRGLVAFLFFVSLPLLPAVASDTQRQPGNIFELKLSYKTDSKNGDGQSTGSSSGRQAAIERVIAVTPAGVELEIDLPDEEARAREWRFPARIFKPKNGPLQLLNESELEERLEAWLQKANWTRDLCGQWIFTWSAFLVDCDPQSAIGIFEDYELDSSKYVEGAELSLVGALDSAILESGTSEADQSVLTAHFSVDPDFVCRNQAESDVIVGQIMGEPVALADATEERCQQDIAGTITETYFPASDDNISKRVRVSLLVITDADGNKTIESRTETLERKRIR